jgi:hypothetical protein
MQPQLLADSIQDAASIFDFAFLFVHFLVSFVSFLERILPFFNLGTAIAAAEDTSHYEGQSHCE